MPAHINDYLTKASPRFRTQLDGPIDASQTTITLVTTSGLPVDTAVYLSIDRVDGDGGETPASEEVIRGVVSGNDILVLERGLEGTAQSHLDEAVVEMVYTAHQHNRHVGWMMDMQSGWAPTPETWVYASANSFTIAGKDMTDVFVPGSRVKFTQDSTVKVRTVESSAFSTDTTVTLYADSANEVENMAITQPNYSYQNSHQDAAELRAVYGNPYAIMGGRLGVNTLSPSYRVHVQDNVASGDLRSLVTLENTSTATGAAVYVRAISNDTIGQYGAFSSTYTAVPNLAGRAVVLGSGLGINIRANESGGDIYLTTNANNDPTAVVRAGVFYVSDTENANMSRGITINQLGNNDEILAFKSTSIAHGVTTLAETDTFALFKKVSTSEGGVSLVSFIDASNSAARITGVTSTNTTVKSASANGTIDIRAAKKSGTGTTDCDSDTNLVVIRNNATTRFIFDAEGTMHGDEATATYSDARLKRDIVDLDNGLDVILGLSPKRFTKYSGDIKDGIVALDENSGRERVGFIAQEAALVAPETVSVPTDPDNSLYTMKNEYVIPYLVDAIHKLNKRIEELECQK